MYITNWHSSVSVLIQKGRKCIKVVYSYIVYSSVLNGKELEKLDLLYKNISAAFFDLLISKSAKSPPIVVS